MTPEEQVIEDARFIRSRSEIWAREENLPGTNDPATIIALVEIAGMAFGVARLLLAKVEEVKRLTVENDQQRREIYRQVTNKEKAESSLSTLQAHADALREVLREINSQIHNLPRSATAQRIVEILNATPDAVRGDGE